MSRRPRLLVVDSRRETLDLLGQVVGEAEARVVTAASAAEALAHLSAQELALALVDLDAPGGDGLALVAALHGEARARDLPILVFTAVHAPERALAAYRAGAVDVLVQPIAREVLGNKIRVFLRLHQQRLEIADGRRRLETVMAAVPAGISFSEDATCTRITGNPALSSMLEVAPTDNVSASAPSPAAPGRQMRYFVDGRELSDRELPLQRAVFERRPVPPMEVEVRLPSGRGLWIEASGAPVVDDRGEVIGGVTVATDITARRALDRALRASEANFRAIFENAGVGIAAVDREGRFVRVNETFARMLRTTTDALRGRTIAELSAPEDGARSMELLARIAAGELEGYAIEKRFRCADGALLWAQVTASRSTDAETGQPTFIGVIEDITARKEAERERQQLLELVERSDDFIASADLEGRLTYLNPAGRALIGLPADRPLSSLRFDEYVPAAWRSFFYDQVLATTRTEGLWRGEMQLRNLTTGALLDVERSTFLLRDPATGEPRSYGTVTRDVTARKRMEAALRESEQRLRAMADAMPQLVWSATAEGVIDYYNARRGEYGGGAAADGEGTWRWESIVHPDDRDQTAREWRKAAAAGAPYACEHRMRMADGSYRWHLSRANPVRNEATGALRWYGTATDIHELREAEQELGRAIEARERVLSVVSHDLRSPLGAIMVQVQLLRQTSGGGPLPAATLDPALARLERQARRMDTLIRELLDVTQLQAGKSLPLERARVNLGEMVRRLVAEHQERTRQHRLELTTPATPLVGLWDGDRLERVFDNLLSNAVKYSPTGGEVRIVVDEAHDDGGAWAEVRVQDHGVGIALQDQVRVFEWFVRGGNVREIQGSGLGLAGAKQIVEQHGGTITVESAEGRGATFTVRLPL